MKTLRTARITFVALLCAASLGGCGDDRAPGTGGVVTEDNAAERVAAAACAAAFRCCTPGAEVDRFLDVTASTESECRTVLKTQLDAQYAALTPRIAAGTVFFNATAAQGCLTQLGSVACGRPLLRDESTGDCGFVYTGTRAVGGACSDDEECLQSATTDVYCGSGDVCTVGSAGVAVGETCNHAEIYCIEGFCADTDLCVARRAVGATCTTYEQCTSGVCTGGSCVARPAPTPTGSACTSDGDCTSENCGCADATCTSSVCQAAICDGV